MPLRSLRPCKWIGCQDLTRETYCTTHAAIRDKEKELTRATHDRARGSASSRGYGAQWQRVREIAIREHPICKCCEDQGVIRASEVIHHVDHDQYNNTRDNLMGLCRDCHERLHGRAK
jgi:5-methylcytosine-specific restriction enzyme A